MTAKEIFMQYRNEVLEAVADKKNAMERVLEIETIDKKYTRQLKAMRKAGVMTSDEYNWLAEKMITFNYFVTTGEATNI